MRYVRINSFVTSFMDDDKHVACYVRQWKDTVDLEKARSQHRDVVKEKAKSLGWDKYHVVEVQGRAWLLDGSVKYPSFKKALEAAKEMDNG